MKVPTIKQCRARMLSGHQRALDCINRGLPVCSESASPGELRGMQKVITTLFKWEAIEVVKEFDSGVGGKLVRLTDRGRELLEG